MTEETTGATPGSRQRRKRKWDQPAALVSTPGALNGALSFSATGLGALSGVPSYLNYFPSLSAVAAQGVGVQSTAAAAAQHNAAIVQKFNQDLLASKGILLQSKIQDELIAREITINDAEPGVRYRLTKRQTQEEIQMKTGAVVITRGRYRAPNGPVDHEKPLYLHISAGVNLKDTAERIKAVDQAAAMVEEMLKQGQQQTQVPAARSSATGNPLNGTVQNPMTFSVFVGFEADPSFNLVGRVRGPNNQYLSHITTQTGSSVVLRGKGSGRLEGSATEESQALHLFISGDNAKSVEDAKVLAQNLLETIRADWFSSRSQIYQPSPSVVPIVSLPAMVTYPTSQPPPFSANLPQNLYGAYYPAIGGAYPTPYATGHTPPPPTYVPATVAVASERTAPAFVNPYASMPPPSKPPSKVYGAVPPPSQLLGDKPADEVDEAAKDSVEGPANVRLRERFSQSSTSSDSNVFATSPSVASAPACTSTSYVENVASRVGLSASSTTNGSSGQNLQQHVTSLPVNRVNESQGSEAAMIGSLGQFSATTSQVLATSQPQAAANSSYGGYGGIYPDVSPFQQVAQALQRPPLPVSVKPVPHSTLMATLTKAQSSSFQEKQSEKQPGQRRKFQEFPVVASSDSPGEEQQQGWRGATSAGLEASKASRDQGFTSSSLTMASREMPPPPLPHKPYSFASSQRNVSSHAVPPSTGVKQTEKNDAPPGTGLKLVEYGEEEDSFPASTTPVPPKPFSNGKPFWAA